MKKLITVTIGIFLLFSAFVMAADLPTDLPKMSFNLKEGWNMVPAFSGGAGYGGSCIEKSESVPVIVYMLNPLNKRYSLLGPYSETSEYRSLADQGYYAAYYAGIWLYASEDCDVWMNDFVGPPNFKMAQGWQFVAKRSWTDDFSVFKNCNIEKLNKWDNEGKKWVYSPSSTSVTEFQGAYNQAEVGEVFAMKFSSECSLDETEIASSILPQPPALE